MSKSFIKVVAGDNLTVELSPLRFDHGRITYRHRTNPFRI